MTSQNPDSTSSLCVQISTPTPPHTLIVMNNMSSILLMSFGKIGLSILFYSLEMFCNPVCIIGSLGKLYFFTLHYFNSYESMGNFAYSRLCIKIVLFPLKWGAPHISPLVAKLLIFTPVSIFETYIFFEVW